jgi:hypothetical protein
VFGGVAASCSIPYLDLPPAAAARDDGGAGRYGEIFARFDFGDFAAPYEDVFAEEEQQGMADEITSWSGSSRYEFCSPHPTIFRFSSCFPPAGLLLPAHCFGGKGKNAFFARGLEVTSWVLDSTAILHVSRFVRQL